MEVLRASGRRARRLADGFPEWRSKRWRNVRAAVRALSATAVGVYRFWRDLGYAVGALMAGVVAVMFGLVWAVHAAGLVTFLSGLVAWAWMDETLPTRVRAAAGAAHPGMLSSLRGARRG